MSEPKKLYAVSSGDYSDYRVHAIFDTKEHATAWLVELGFEWQEPARKGWTGWWEWTSDAPRPKPFELTATVEEFDYYEGDVLPLSGQS